MTDIESTVVDKVHTLSDEIFDIKMITESVICYCTVVLDDDDFFHDIFENIIEFSVAVKFNL